MKNTVAIVVAITFLSIFIIVLVRFVIRKDEDKWLCENGKWIKHGNPKLFPTGICGTPSPIFEKLPFTPKKTDVPDDQYVSIAYQPMQCEFTPWDKWAQSGELKFIKAPSEEEIITLYYSMKQQVYIQNVRRINLNERVCQACSICPKNYFFIAEVAPSDFEKMRSLKWNIYEL